MSDPDYLFQRATSLITTDPDEAIRLFREGLRLEPRDSGAWFNLAMLLDRGKSEERYEAWARFVEVAPPELGAYIDFAERTLREAGRPVPARRSGDPDDANLVSLDVEGRGGRTLLLLNNDTGLPPRQVLDTLQEFTDSDDWVSAYLLFDDHPELRSEFVQAILRHTSQDGPPQAALQAKTNLTMLRRAEEIGALEAFAEGDQSRPEEFRDLVRAVREIEPILAGMQGMSPEQIPAYFDAHPRLSRDDGTYLLIARRMEQSGDDQRRMLEAIRGGLERHAVGLPVLREPDEDLGPAAAQIEDLRRRAYSGGTATQFAAVAREGEALLGGATMTRAGRVATLVATARAYLILGEKTERPQSYERVPSLLAEAARIAQPGRSEDRLVASTFGFLAIRRYEDLGDADALVTAVPVLTAARERIGRYRSEEPPLLMVLGILLRLCGEAAGDPDLFRQSLSAFEDATRILPRDSHEWLETTIGELEVLIRIAETGAADALDLARHRVDEVLAHPGVRSGIHPMVWDLTGRMSSAEYDLTGDPALLDTALERYRNALAAGPGNPSFRNNLVRALVRRHERTGNPDDLEEARQEATAALRTVAPAAPIATLIRRNLVRVLMALNDVEPGAGHPRRALDLLRTDRRLLPPGPARALAMLNLMQVALFIDGQAPDESLRAEAFDAYREGLTTLDPSSQPGDATRIGRAMAHEFVGLGDWTEAGNLYDLALAGIAAQTSRTTSEQWWAAMSGQVDEIVQEAAYCAAKAGRPDRAITVLETYRARNLRRALQLEAADLTALTRAGHGDLAEAYLTRLDERAATGYTQNVNSESFLGRRTRLIEDQLTVLRTRIRALPGFGRFGAEPDFGSVRAASTGEVIVYLVATQWGGLAMCLDAQGTPHTVDLPDLIADEAGTRVSAYLRALGAYRQSNAARAWQAALDTVGHWLFVTILEPLRTVFPGGQLTVVTAGRLGLLPLTAAQHPGTGEAAVDVFALRCVPSATALGVARDAARRNDVAPGSTLAVIDPQPVAESALRWAVLEDATLTARGGRSVFLRDTAATLTEVMDALPRHSVLHFACHGVAYPDRPLDSFLTLSGDEKLTIRGLVQSGRLPTARLAFLSACDTSVAGTAVPQEVVSLPSALLQLGCGAVIAAQWPVAEQTAAIFAAHFYERWQAGTSPSDAFVATQRWLRRAGRTEVSRRLRQQATGRPEIAALAAELPLEAVPFAAVSDWAAFVYTGS